MPSRLTMWSSSSIAPSAVCIGSVPIASLRPCDALASAAIVSFCNRAQRDLARAADRHRSCRSRPTPPGGRRPIHRDRAGGPKGHIARQGTAAMPLRWAGTSADPGRLRWSRRARHRQRRCCAPPRSDRAKRNGHGCRQSCVIHSRIISTRDGKGTVPPAKSLMIPATNRTWRSTEILIRPIVLFRS